MTDSTPNTSYSVRGGARIGWVNYSWPFASLRVERSQLVIVTRFILPFATGRYGFRPDQVIRIDPSGWLPLIGQGIRIHHTVPDYPEKIIFWGRPSTLLRGIASTGFSIPPDSTAVTAADGAIPPRGFPLRIWPLVVIGVIWNLLFRYDSTSAPFPGPFIIAALLLALITASAALRFPAVQAILLRPGRHFGEVRPVFHLVATVTLFLAVVSTVFFLTGAFMR